MPEPQGPGNVPQRCARCSRLRPSGDMATLDERSYCHGAWDRGPTCYEQATWDETLARGEARRRAALGYRPKEATDA